MRFQRKDVAGVVVVLGTMITLFAHTDDEHQESHLPLIVDAGGAATMARAVETVAMVGFDVLPMTGEGLLRDQVVIIQGGLIQRIGRVGVIEVPVNARTIVGSSPFCQPAVLLRSTFPLPEKQFFTAIFG